MKAVQELGNSQSQLGQLSVVDCALSKLGHKLQYTTTDFLADFFALMSGILIYIVKVPVDIEQSCCNDPLFQWVVLSGNMH